MITFALPWPPSLNHAWRRVGARTVLAKSQRAYREAVERALSDEKLVDDDYPAAPVSCPLNGPLAVSLRLFAPNRRAYDIDNRPKPVLDALTKAGFWGDDGQINILTISRQPPSRDNSRVEVCVWRSVPMG